MPAYIGNFVKDGSSTIAANKISIVLAAPGAGLKRVIRLLHMQVNAADAGSGLVTCRLIRGSQTSSWPLLFDATQGCWWDGCAEIEGDVNEAVTVEVERTGLTSAFISFERCLKQGV